MLLKRIPTIFKALVLVLVLANGVYWAYTQGWGASWGWAPANPSELQRLKAQVQPDALKVVSAVPVNDGIPVAPPASTSAATPAPAASSTTPPSASAAPSAEASSIQEPTSSTSRPPEPSTPEPTAPPATPAPPAPPAAPAVTPPPAQPINRDKAPVKPSEAPPTIATSPAPTSAPAPLSAANNLTKPVALACMQSQVLTKARVASVRQQLEGLAAVPKPLGTGWPTPSPSGGSFI